MYSLKTFRVVKRMGLDYEALKKPQLSMLQLKGLQR